MELNKTKEDNRGNVLSNSKEPLRVYGNPPTKNNSKIGLAMLAGLGLGIGLVLMSKKHRL